MGGAEKHQIISCICSLKCISTHISAPRGSSFIVIHPSPYKCQGEMERREVKKMKHLLSLQSDQTWKLPHKNSNTSHFHRNAWNSRRSLILRKTMWPLGKENVTSHGRAAFWLCSEMYHVMHSTLRVKCRSKRSVQRRVHLPHSGSQTHRLCSTFYFLPHPLPGSITFPALFSLSVTTASLCGSALTPAVRLTDGSSYGLCYCNSTV